MTSKKPNQVIDEITSVIYPPAEAVVNELSTIRAIIPSTIAMYEETQDIHTIQPNLDMIERAIEYLRGAPMRDELRPPETDTLKPTIIPYTSGINITTEYVGKGVYNVTMTGTDVVPSIHYPELFGELDIDVVTCSIGMPVVCGRAYEVVQKNPLLALYEEDPYITEVDGEWIKKKTYDMDEDTFEYAFLVPDGRNQIQIKVTGQDSDEVYTFNITTHIHFKEIEEIPEEGENLDGEV